MKLKYLIPNFFTACSLVSGIFALKFTLQHQFLIAGWLIAVSIVCDGLDGKLARMLNASSKFGRIFDTVSDFFAFGIVPAVLAYICVLQKYAAGGIIIAMIYVLGGAFRLTRFMRKTTVSEEKQPFTGLPIPAAAGLLASFLLFQLHLFREVKSPVFTLILTLLISFLMVSHIEYVSLDPKAYKNKLVLIFCFIAGAVLFILYPYYIYFIFILLYILSGLFSNFLSSK